VYYQFKSVNIKSKRTTQRATHYQFNSVIIKSKRATHYQINSTIVKPKKYILRPTEQYNKINSSSIKTKYHTHKNLRHDTVEQLQKEDPRERETLSHSVIKGRQNLEKFKFGKNFIDVQDYTGDWKRGFGPRGRLWEERCGCESRLPYPSPQREVSFHKLNSSFTTLN
jgi:hypothetical protein